MYYMGGKLAHWFGITSPDWQYAIDVYEEMKREVSQPWAHRGGVEAGGDTLCAFSSRGGW